MEVTMPEQNNTFSDHKSGEQLERIGNTWMSKDEKETRMKWYENSMKAFDFDNPVCPKCNNFTFFSVIYREKGWQYYHCGCGFQAHKEIKLDTKHCGREDRTNKEHRPALKIMEERICQRCGEIYICSQVAAYKKRKYCGPCKPEVQRELKTGVKKGSYKPRLTREATT
jgi:ribosomal protein S27AE